MPFLVGQTYTSSIDVVDKTGNPAVPSGVTLTITHLGTSDAPVTPVITPAAHMSYDFVLPSEGWYRFDWVPVNPGAPVTETVPCRALLSVEPIAAVRDWLGVNDTRTDAKLLGMMHAATLLTERVVGTVVPRTFTNEWISGQVRSIIQAPHGPILNSTSVTALSSIYPGGPSWAASRLLVNPVSGTVYPIDQIDFWLGPWNMTYVAGRLIPSDDITNGWKEILWDLWITQRNLTGDANQPDIIEAQSFEAQLPSDYHIPGRAAELLEGERYHVFG